MHTYRGEGQQEQNLEYEIKWKRGHLQNVSQMSRRIQNLWYKVAHTPHSNTIHENVVLKNIVQAVKLFIIKTAALYSESMQCSTYPSIIV